jgi:Family of unknown function (DUF6518)
MGEYASHELARGARRAPFGGSVPRAALVLISGLAVGAVTSFGQTCLDGAFDAFVNSAAAWLVAPFLVGSRMRSRPGAAAAGFALCVLQLVGYYATADLRGFAAGRAIVLFWAVCAVAGGPVFGVAGHLWRRGSDSKRGLGAAVLAAAFLAEGTWVYLHELHYYATAALWLAIGTVLALTMTHGHSERRWLVLTVSAGLLAEVLLTQVYNKSF